MPRTLSLRFPLTAVPTTNLSEPARRTGYPLRTIQRAGVSDGIPYWSADRVAIRLGIHPSLIRTDWVSDHEDERSELPITLQVQCAV
jgi:hypothetical protein